MRGTFLLDSGVWVATVNSDDPFESASRRLIAAKRRFGALDLTLYEVANVIGLKRGRPLTTRLTWRLLVAAVGNWSARTSGTSSPRVWRSRRTPPSNLFV
jgi:hypothetical protein